MRARLLVAGVAAASLVMCLLAPARAAEPAIVVEGDGAGHGVGMAQDGALAMGRAGAETAQILDAFYPGTQLGAGGGTIGVRVLEGGDANVTVSFPAGGRITARAGPQPPGFPISVPAGGEVVLSRESAGLRVRARIPISPIVAVESPTSTSTTSSSATSTTAMSTTATRPPATTVAPPITAAKVAAPGAPVPMTTTPPAPPRPAATPAPADVPVLEHDSRSPVGVRLEPSPGSTITVVARSRTYRGVLDADPSAGGGIALVNRLDIEQYLKGMGEVIEPSWPAAALQAQAIAARTYALRAVRNGGEICDDDRCQVYLGAQVEYAAMNRAVDDTAGQVLTYGGALASTVYSSSAGGVTATPAEGFGTSDEAFPYLVTKPYAMPADRHWSMAFAPADVARRLHYPGNLERIEVTKTGPSGRSVELSVIGDAGPVLVTGTALVYGLGLPSSLFRLSTGDAPPEALAAPPPPPVQLAPDDVVSIVASPVAGSLLPRQAPSRGSNATHAIASELALVVAGALALIDRRRRQGRLAGFHQSLAGVHVSVVRSLRVAGRIIGIDRRRRPS